VCVTHQPPCFLFRLNLDHLNNTKAWRAYQSDIYQTGLKQRTGKDASAEVYDIDLIKRIP
jgi:hypothetical protein